MKKIILIALFFKSLLCFSQSELLANQYYERGEFEKATILFEEVVAKNPTNSSYLLKLVYCYQQLESFDKAEKILISFLKKYKQTQILVEIGYNYQLQKKEKEAEDYYNKAFDKIEENPSNAYSIAPTFEKKSQLQNAMKAYEIAKTKNSQLNFNYQMALLYGQMGQLEEMIDKLLDEVTEKPQTTAMIQNYLMRFMENNTESTFDNLLRKSLLLRVQQTQDIYWNQFLSWFFVQQRQFDRAFVQEKAIYKRAPESLSNILSLAEFAIEEKELETAKEILIFVLENTQNKDLQISAHSFLFEMKLENVTSADYELLEKEFELILKKYGISPYSLELQKLFARFQTFYLNKPNSAITLLENALKLPLNEFQVGEVKMLLGDIYLHKEQFNQALLMFAQVETNLKNDEIGNQATFKMAQTAYFSADFDWALTQLKVLKSSTSLLIANDALEIYLLINGQTYADSSRTALKKFAKGDFYRFQNKTQQAIEGFEKIKELKENEEIMDLTLLRLGTCYQKQKKYTEAIANYKTLIDDYEDSIYSDEALYFLGLVYLIDLNNPSEAQKYFEKIIFNHQDSIYFVEARKKFRAIRGDSNL